MNGAGYAAPLRNMIENSSSPLVVPPTLLSLFTVFLRIGLFSFGGGLSGWIFREVVTLRGWIDEDEFMSGLAVAQILPGANVANLSLYIGQKLFGITGAVVALVGLLSGPFFARLVDANRSGVAASMVLFDLGGITERSGEDVLPPVVPNQWAVNHGCYSSLLRDTYSAPCPISFEAFL